MLYAPVSLRGTEMLSPYLLSLLTDCYGLSAIVLLTPELTSPKVCYSPVQWTEESIAPVAPSYTYAAVSLSNVVATTCQYEALKYVTFPLQTLGKTAKMIPVMLWGSIIGGKRCVAMLIPSVCQTSKAVHWLCAKYPLL